MSNEFLKITADTLKKWEACAEMFARLRELLPDGGTLVECITALDDAGDGFGCKEHEDWSYWLFFNASRDGDYKEQCANGYRNSGDYNTGYRNSGDYNTGYRNSGNLNTGDYNSGNLNTGDYNSGDYNTGYRNTGDYNTGYRNSGDYNTGNRNTGNLNTGDYNSGDYNTGNRNTGNLNTGDYNSGDYNTGWFNDDTPDTIRVFGIETDRVAFLEMEKPDFIFNVNVSYWVEENDMTDEDKAADLDSYVRGGQLRKRDYKEAWKLAWDTADVENRELIRTLPNFNAEKFFNITGIDLR